MKNNDLCVVDVTDLWVYDFASGQKDVEKILTRANQSNKEDIKTWEKNCRDYPEAEAFKDHLLKAQNKKYQIMTYAEFLQLERDTLLNKPLTEITAETYNDMLNVLPPLKWRTINNVEMFCMSEMLTGYYTSQYSHDKRTDKYYHKIVDITDQTTWGYNFI